MIGHINLQGSLSQTLIPTPLSLSVIICTHNPRQDHLDRTLSALQAQTLALTEWELLLIDNASKEPLELKWDLSWHPQGRHIREGELGLTPARLRGIREARSAVLVFVDDDNILDSDYLCNALKLTISHPWVGVFGGNIIGEFETSPEQLTEDFLSLLANISVKHEEWVLGLGTKIINYTPCGAGMVIRRNIASYYAEISTTDQLRRDLDRKGGSLLSGGDIDLALCSSVFGLAVGRFPQLQMKHLIPECRIRLDYLSRLAEGTSYSFAILQYIWDGQVPCPDVPCRSERMFLAYQSFRRRLVNRDQSEIRSKFKNAWNLGIMKAVPVIRAHIFSTATNVS